MSDRLSLSQVAALMANAATTAGGQLLFKTPALDCRTVIDAAVICIVLILCGLSFIVG